MSCVEAVSSGCQSAQSSRDELLIRFMYYVCNGNDVVNDGRMTPLEKALSALQPLEPLCSDSVAQLADNVTLLIKHQVPFISVCRCQSVVLSLAVTCLARLTKLPTGLYILLALLSSSF